MNLERMGEISLSGGRVTRGVVRIEETVRRPARPNSVLVRALLAHLAEREPGLAPRYLGADERPQCRASLALLPHHESPRSDRIEESHRGLGGADDRRSHQGGAPVLGHEEAIGEEVREVSPIEYIGTNVRMFM